MKKTIFLLFILILIVAKSWATHLVGGNLGYEYVGQFGSNYRYKILLTVYNNCDASSLVPLPAANYDIGVYTQDVPNNPMGGGDKTLFTTVTVNLIDSNKIQPPTTSGCSVGAGVCIYKANYEGFVDLPLNFNGYHLFFQNFARNNAIANLLNPGNSGMAFQAYIPPNLVPNSTPVFSDDPVPFLCINDTVSLLNTAYDPDGDLLIFSFVTPFEGTNANNPPTTLPWTIPTVTYNAGYSTLFPFGPAGYATIDGATGLTQYMSPNTGNYAVAIEIREYRNGNLIGVSRRDLQLLVINCPPNPAPNLSNTGGSGITNYTITECDNLCFPITFTDQNGDSLKLEVSGPIFDTSFVNPAASVDSLSFGDSTVTASFCWSPGCDASRPAPYLFTATATDNGCPPKSSSVVYQITVNPPDAPDTIFGNMVVCQYQTESYSVTQQAGYTYSWNVTNGTINSGQGTNAISVIWNTVGTGTISVVGYSNCGCPSNPLDTTVSILSAPIADAGNDTTICYGDTVQLGGSPTGSSGTNISWTPVSSLSNSTLANPLAFPISTTSYIVTVDNGTCQTNDTVLVIVGSSVISVSNDTSICIGDTVQLNASGGISYLWTPGITLNDSTVSNPLAFPSTTTSYVVSITDTLGCTTYDTVVVTVNPLPTVFAGNDTSICINDTITLIATGATNYSWTPTSSLSNPNAASTDAYPTSTTQYIVTGTDANSCSNTDTVVVTVNPLPSISISGSNYLCPGDTMQLLATGGISYLWSPNTNISNISSSSPMVYPLTSTTYTVLVADNNGCYDTATHFIAVSASVPTEAGRDTTICLGDSVTIGGSPSAPNGSTYMWTPITGLSNPTLPNPIAFPTITTTYYLTATNDTCTGIDSVTIIVNALTNLMVSNDTAICINDTATLIASGADTYTWTPNGSLTSTNNDTTFAFPTTTTPYIVSATDTNGCSNTDTVLVTVNSLPAIFAGNDTNICINDTIALTATGAINYSWMPTISLSNPTSATTDAFPTITTQYVVLGTDVNGCSNTDTILITVNPLPTIFAGNDTNICINDTITLTATGATNYSWMPTISLSSPTSAITNAFPTITTQYVVLGTDANNCFNTDTVIVTVNPLPAVFAGNDTVACEGGSVQIQASGAMNYQWLPSATLSNTSIPNPIASPTTPTTYIVTGTDINGCQNSDSVFVDIFTFIFPNDTTICELTQASLFVGQSIATSNTVYDWTPGTLLNDSTIAFPTTNINATTTFTVIAEAPIWGCIDTGMVTVNVESAVQPAFEYSKELICEGLEVSFTNLTSNSSGFEWDFGDGTSSSEVNPIHVFDFSKTYTITLYSLSASNCRKDTSVTITVDDFKNLFDINISTVFTPNGDGVNEYFEAKVNGRTNLCTTVIIFNRWGQKVFESENYTTQWDGYTNAGKLVPAGTYYYVITIKDFEYKGSITVIR